MHLYRTHTCNALAAADVGREARLSGWVHRRRDHGNLIFIDLRDHYGTTQCVVTAESPAFEAASALRLESVISLRGAVAEASVATECSELFEQGKATIRLCRGAIRVGSRRCGLWS